MGGFFHSSTSQSFVPSAVSTGTQRTVPNLHPAFVHSPRCVFAKSFYPAVRPDDWCLRVIAVECVSGRNKFPFLLSELPQLPQLCVFSAKSDLVKAVWGYCVSALLSEEELVCVPPSQMMLQVCPHPPILHPGHSQCCFPWKTGKSSCVILKKDSCVEKQSILLSSPLPLWKNSLKLFFLSCHKFFLQKHSDTSVQRGLHTPVHWIKSQRVSVGLGSASLLRSTCNKDWKAQQEFQTWIGLWFYQKILQTTNDECFIPSGSSD